MIVTSATAKGMRIMPKGEVLGSDHQYWSEEPLTKKRIQKAVLWDYWFQLNDLKVTLLRLKIAHSSHRREKKLHTFLAKCAADSPTHDHDVKNLVYMCVLDNCSKEYIGETSTGRKTRIATHVRQTFRYKGGQHFHRELRKQGTHSGIWIVLHAWHDSTDVSKIQRLRREGTLIWFRNSSWNKTGGKRFVQAGPEESQLIFGKQKRWKPFKRVSDKYGGAKMSSNIAFSEAEDQFEVTRYLMGLAFRLSRRPWKTPALIGDSEISKKVHALDSRRLLRLVKLGNEILDVSGTSIFKKKLDVVLQGSGKLTSLSWELRVPGLWLPHVRKDLEREIADLCSKQASSGKVLVIYARVYPAASKSITDLCGNATTFGRCMDEKCNCSDPRFSTMQRLEGHVFQPLLEFMASTDLELPTGLTPSLVVPRRCRTSSKLSQRA